MIINKNGKQLECDTLLGCSNGTIDQKFYDEAGPFEIFVREKGFYHYDSFSVAKTLYQFSEQDIKTIKREIQKEMAQISICYILWFAYIAFTLLILLYYNPVPKSLYWILEYGGWFLSCILIGHLIGSNA